MVVLFLQGQRQMLKVQQLVLYKLIGNGEIVSSVEMYRTQTFLILIICALRSTNTRY